MALIPVILEFSGVARDSNLHLTLSTDGATWSIGGDDVQDTEGFSYNGLAMGEARPTCLTAIELTDSVLAIRTSPNATGTAFSLQLFLDVQPEVESVQGRCTLNAGASVICHLGYDIGAEWRSGPFSAMVPSMPVDARRVRFSIQNAPVGAPISIDLITERSEGEAYWCFDSGVSGASGLTLHGATGTALPLRTISITDRQIVVVPGGAQKIASDLSMELYLRRTVVAATPDRPEKKLKRFHLLATCDPKAVVAVQIGAQRWQNLAATYNCMYF